MFTAFLLTISAIWTAVVVDVIAESASSGAAKLSLFGHVLYRPAAEVGIIILTALAASAAFALSISVAFSNGRRVERRMASDLDGRWEAISMQSAGSTARNELLEWRNASLQVTLEELLSKRDELLSEMAAVRVRTAALRQLAREQTESLSRFADATGAGRDPGQDLLDLTVIPDIDIDAEPGVAPVDITTLVSTRPRRGSARKRAQDVDEANGAGGAGAKR